MIVACQIKSRGSITDPFNSGFHSCFIARAQAVLLVSAGWCPNTSYLWLRPLSNFEQHLNVLCSAVSLANMDSPVQPPATGMLSLHLEAEGGNGGKSLFLAEPSQSGQKSGDVASVSEEDANEKRRKTKNVEGLREQRRQPPRRKNKQQQRTYRKNAQVIAENAKLCLTSMPTKTLAKSVCYTKKHFGAMPKARTASKI